MATPTLALVLESEREVATYHRLLREFGLTAAYDILIGAEAFKSVVRTGKAAYTQVFAVQSVFHQLSTLESKTATSLQYRGLTIWKVPNAANFHKAETKGRELWLDTGLRLKEPFMSDSPTPQYTTLTDMTALQHYLQSIQAYVTGPTALPLFLDIETRGIDPRSEQARIACIGCYVPIPDSTHPYYNQVAIIVLDHKDNRQPKAVQTALLHYWMQWCMDQQVRLVGHHLKFDINYLAVHTNNYALLDNYYADTLVMAYTLHGKMFHFSLEQNIRYYLNIRGHKDAVKDFLRKNYSKQEQGYYDQVPGRLLFPYLASDVYVTYWLYYVLHARLVQDQLDKFYYETLQPIVQLTLVLEWHGNYVSLDRVQDLEQSLQAQLSQVVQQLRDYRLTEAVLHSPARLKHFLREWDFALRSLDNTSEATLLACKQQLADPTIIDLILEYRSLEKKINTYVVNLKTLRSKQTGCVHPQFNVTGTITGRLSSSDPNFQNIPFKDPIKAVITSRFGDQGVLIQSDYKGAELRVLANISGDESLIADLSDPTKDLHTLNAAAMFKRPIDEVDAFLRKRAKNAFFALIYGSTEYGLARQLEVSIEEAKSIIENFYQHRVKVGALDQQLRKDFIKGKLSEIVTPTGRKIYPKVNILSSSRDYQDTARKLLNYLIQGTSSDFCMIGAVELWRQMRALGLQSKIINVVHDSIIVDTPYTEVDTVLQLIRVCQVDYINQRFGLVLPLDNEVEIGSDWYHLVACQRTVTDQGAVQVQLTGDLPALERTFLMYTLVGLPDSAYWLQATQVDTTAQQFTVLLEKKPN